MDDYKHDGSSIIKIPRKNLFQEHTKGELVQMIKPYLKGWIHCVLITPGKKNLRLWGSLHLLDDAKKFFSDWKASNPIIIIGGMEYPLNVSRTGWRHITNKARKERVALSLRLLPIAKIILERSEEIRPVVLRSRVLDTMWDSTTYHLGYRARVVLDGREQKVQVVVKIYRNLRNSKEKVWFYSVHIVK